MIKENIIVLRLNNSEVGIIPNLGGSIAFYRWVSDGRCVDFVRPATESAVAERAVRGMGCFPLVPFSNRIRDGRFTFAGHHVRLPLNTSDGRHSLHGHGWQMSWMVREHTPQSLKITFEHNSNGWPFPYRAEQTFRLKPDSLYVEIAVTNTGHFSFPVGLGLHPYFPRTPQTRLTAHVSQMWETDSEMMPTELRDPPSARKLDGVLVDEIAMDNGFTNWDGHARIDWPERKAALEVSATAPLRFLVVYTPPGEPFFCAEPVSNCTDAFNLAAQGRNDTGTIVLKSSETVAAEVKFAPEIY